MLPAQQYRPSEGEGNQHMQTYAFLDEGSTVTFCIEELIQQLNANGRKRDILLKTMGQDKPVSLNCLMSTRTDPSQSPEKTCQLWAAYRCQCPSGRGTTESD